MNPHAAEIYGKQDRESWNRIDMLLALYESGLTALVGAMEAEKAGDSPRADKLRMKSLRVIQGLIAGLDLNQGEIPNQMLRLFEFAHHAIHSRQPDHLANSHQVLSALHEAFSQIRADAVELERDGTIPSLETTRFEFTV